MLMIAMQACNSVTTMSAFSVDNGLPVIHGPRTADTRTKHTDPDNINAIVSIGFISPPHPAGLSSSLRTHGYNRLET